MDISTDCKLRILWPKLKNTTLPLRNDRTKGSLSVRELSIPYNAFWVKASKLHKHFKSILNCNWICKMHKSTVIQNTFLSLLITSTIIIMFSLLWFYFDLIKQSRNWKTLQQQLSHLLLQCSFGKLTENSETYPSS